MKHRRTTSYLVPRSISYGQQDVTVFRPRNEKMDTLVKHIHSSDTFSLKNAHTALMSALKAVKALS